MTGFLPRELIDSVARAASIEDVVARRVPGYDRRKREACCPFHKEKTPSFKVNVGRGTFKCFGCGVGGSSIKFVMLYEHRDFRAAVLALAEDYGIETDGFDEPETEEEKAARVAQARAADAARREEDVKRAAYEARERMATREWCLKVWKEAKPAAGTIVETYIRGRAITLPIPASLRHHAARRHTDTGLVLPGMVAPIQAPDGSIAGLHTTFLKADGSGKSNVSNAKKVNGVLMRCAIRLAPAAETLALAEGIETCLSVMQATGLPAWATISLGNLAGGGRGMGAFRRELDRKGERLPPLEPDMDKPGIILPAAVRRVVIFADADNKDPLPAEILLQRGAMRLEREGRSVEIVRPPVGMDWNDVVKAPAGSVALETWREAKPGRAA